MEVLMNPKVQSLVNQISKEIQQSLHETLPMKYNEDSINTVKCCLENYFKEIKEKRLLPIDDEPDYQIYLDSYIKYFKVSYKSNINSIDFIMEGTPLNSTIVSASDEMEAKKKVERGIPNSKVIDVIYEYKKLDYSCMNIDITYRPVISPSSIRTHYLLSLS